MVRTRIAPSPTGYPHIGTVYSALINYAFAKKHQGRFLVRIEDTDRERLVSDAEAELYQILDWLGLSEDESPRKKGKLGPYRQSERLTLYKKYALRLIGKGHAYYCFCSKERLEKLRKKQQKEGRPPMYDKACQKLTKEETEKKLKMGESYVIRLKVPQKEAIEVNDLIRGKINFESQIVDDQVLLKSDGYPTYHLAVVVDDHLMEISHAIRGEEWLSSAPKHVLLYRFFGWQEPVWIHTPTLRSPDRSKLSKRKGHTQADWYRKQGFLPEAVLNYLSLLGWSHPQEKEIFSQKEFIKLFDLQDLSPIGPIFDLEKLKWLNGKYIRSLDDRKLLENLKPFLKLKLADETFKKAIPQVKERLEVLSDINQLLKFLESDLKINTRAVKKESRMDSERIKKLLKEAELSLGELKSWQAGVIEKTLRGLKEKYPDLKPREFFMTIRVASTGFPVTPPLFASLELMGKKLTLSRIKEVIKNL